LKKGGQQTLGGGTIPFLPEREEEQEKQRGLSQGFVHRGGFLISVKGGGARKEGRGEVEYFFLEAYVFVLVLEHPHCKGLTTRKEDLIMFDRKNRISHNLLPKGGRVSGIIFLGTTEKSLLLHPSGRDRVHNMKKYLSGKMLS